MKIGIFGAGKVGVTLGKYLMDAGITVTGFYSRTFQNAVTAAEFTETAAFQQSEELIKVSDTLFIAVPDREISRVWDCITEYELTDKIICHFSGSLSSNIFSGIEDTGASGCSIHPMFAFSDRFTSHQQFHKAYLTMEGQEKALVLMKKLFGSLGHTVLTVREEDKPKYHAAASLASNYMIGLMQLSLNLLEECGFSSKDSMNLLRPIVAENTESMLGKGTAAALTGPVERNDLLTVEKHLKALHGDQGESVYRDLGRILVDIAELKNPDSDYTALRKLLESDIC